jgi:hypothetical protein
MRGRKLAITRTVAILALAAALGIMPSSAVRGDDTPHPNIWIDLYGTASYLGQAAPVDAHIQVFDQRGVQCGEMIVTTAGAMSPLMPCYGDDGVYPGARAGDVLRFTINGATAQTEAVSLNGNSIPPETPVIWDQSGSLWQVNLRARLDVSQHLLVSSANLANLGQEVTFSTAVVGNGPNGVKPTGYVQFADGGVALNGGRVALVNGQAAFTTAGLAVGLHTITAAYEGDPVFYPSTATLTQEVRAWIDLQGTASYLGQPAPVGAHIAVFDPQGAQCGEFIVTEAGSYGVMRCYGDNPNTPQDEGPVPGEVLSLKIDGAPAQTEVVSIDGVSQPAETPVTWNQARSSWRVNLQARLDSTLALVSSANPATLGQSVTFTASVTPADATGLVEFFDGVTSLGSVALSGGTCAFSTSALSVGAHSIAAVYGGDNKYARSTSDALQQEIVANPLNYEKQQVLADLQALLPRLHKDDKPKLTSAIAHLQKSLSLDLWLDGSHPKPGKKGETVFNEEKAAVVNLRDLGARNKSGLTPAQMKVYINRLVDTDRALAALAISEAEARGGRAAQIASAKTALASGDVQASKNSPDKAIDQYKTAWKNAIAA